MFWRFLAACDPDVDIMISRDADSRLSKREKFAVEEWINSNYQFHIIRDHPYHSVPILGGMWGSKKGLLSNIGNLINDYQKGDFLGVDQDFLGKHIYPMVEIILWYMMSFLRKNNFQKNLVIEVINTLLVKHTRVMGIYWI
jgi:hypothetical protein